MLCNRNLSIKRGSQRFYLLPMEPDIHRRGGKKWIRRGFLRELMEVKDLSGSSKRRAELSTLLNTLHSATSSLRSDSLL